MNSPLIRTDSAQAAADAGARQPITVDVDDSRGAAAALEWAAGEAAARHVPLRIVHAWSWQRLEPWSSAIDRRVIADLRAEGDRLVSRYERRARAISTDVPIETQIVEGYAPDVLTIGADSAGLLVVGSHRLRSAHRVALGSVANAVTGRASCPIAVVWGPIAPAPESGIVVGVAGDAQDEDVLAFGFAYAQRHGLPLRAVHCWTPAPLADHTLPIPDRAHRWLGESLAGWCSDYPDVPVHADVVRGHPVDGLVDAARDQRLLVVGRRGTHRFTSLLGSTSLGAIHSAECPVAVIPPPRAHRTTRLTEGSTTQVAAARGTTTT